AAVDALNSMFLYLGVNPDEPQELHTVERLSRCPLGGSDKLAAGRLVLPAGAEPAVVASLEMGRDGVPIVRCSFRDPADSSSSLDFQASHIRGELLKHYLDLMEGGGYEQVGPLFGGAMYSRCTSPNVQPNSA